MHICIKVTYVQQQDSYQKPSKNITRLGVDMEKTRNISSSIIVNTVEISYSTDGQAAITIVGVGAKRSPVMHDAHSDENVHNVEKYFHLRPSIPLYQWGI